MDKRSFSGISHFYFQRFAFRQPELYPLPTPELRTIVVIPCHREPALLDTLASLRKCTKTQWPVEVWVVLNQSEAASEDTRQYQQSTLLALQSWVEKHSDRHLSFHIWEENALPVKHAGVGLARKAGMDIALGRFLHLHRADGAIVCLDADCTVSDNYLSAIEKQFVEQEKTGFATLPYEHPLENFTRDNLHLKEGIIRYELFLRYYIRALKTSGYPFAFHTIGSSMAVKAEAYARHRGMNRRKAGEDFYFLHTLAPHEVRAQVSEATVYPSARLSDRVPFGTGKAQQDWVMGKAAHQAVYHPQIFSDLTVFMHQVDGWYNDAERLTSVENRKKRLPSSIVSFLDATDFDNQWQGMLRNTASLAAFRKQFFLWFDGFRVLKFVHFCHQSIYPAVTLEAALPLLFNQAGMDRPMDNSLMAWLTLLRNMDRDA